MGDLDPKPYISKLRELHDFVKVNLPPNIKEAHEAALREAEENGEDEETIRQLEFAAVRAASAEGEPANGPNELDTENEFRTKVNALHFAE